MELNFADNFDNIITLIKEDSNNLLEVLDFIEDNFNEILLQRLNKKLKETKLDISEQLNSYFYETLSLEENILLFQSDLSYFLDVILLEIDNGNYDLHDWTVQYRDKLTSIITKYYKRFKKEELKVSLKKIYSLLIINGLNSKKFEMFIAFMQESDNYCRIRRKIFSILGVDSDILVEDISNKTKLINNKINQIFSKLQVKYASLKNQGVFKIGLLSKELPSQSKMKIYHEADKLFSCIFQAKSSQDVDSVKLGVANMDLETKRLISNKLVGLNKTVLAESKSIEGIFYRSIRFANQL